MYIHSLIIIIRYHRLWMSLVDKLCFKTTIMNWCVGKNKGNYNGGLTLASYTRFAILKTKTHDFIQEPQVPANTFHWL